MEFDVEMYFILVETRDLKLNMPLVFDIGLYTILFQNHFIHDIGLEIINYFMIHLCTSI